MVGKPWEIDLTVYDDEAALLAGLRRRERLACTCLLKRFAPQLYRLALRLTGDPEEAEEALQEGFINACAHIDDFAAQSSLGTWLHRIVRNAALGQLRRKRPPTLPLTGADDEQFAPAAYLADTAPGPESEALRAELRAATEHALLALPDALRVAFVLRDLEGLSTREAANALVISEAALKVRLHRAHLALRAPLAAYWRESAEAAPLPAPLEDRLLANLCADA